MMLTIEDKEIIRDNYKTISDREIGEMIGRSANVVASHRLNIMQLKKPKSVKKISKKQNFIEKKCIVCKSVFKTNRPRQVTCSTICRATKNIAIITKYNKKMLKERRIIQQPIHDKKKCPSCKKLFIPISSTHKYCSFKCRNNRPDIPFFTCERCKKKFKPKSSNFSKSRVKFLPRFCSFKCRWNKK